jgi:glyoxylase-like metal-dependent hydrolase (beta-lactamase superfamily II)
MFKHCVAGLTLCALVSAPAWAQDARTAIDNAAKAMGDLRTVEFSATGFDFVLGQNFGASTPWPKFINRTYTRSIDFQTPSSRVDRVRMQGENPPRGGGQQPVIGEQPQNQTIVVGANTPWAQQLEIWMMPHGFLKAAAANNATVKSQSIGGKKYTVLTFVGQNKAPVSGFVNAENMVERVETRIDNAFFGDMPFEAVYSDYKDFGGVKFPGKIVQKQGGHPILDLDIVSVRPNVAVSIQAPQGRGGGAPAAAAAPARGGAQTPAVPTEKLGDGVYLILGGYACLAIEFKDHIVVIEGPQSEARATAVIAEARKLIPNKPIRYVVNTHAHIDHSSGLRAFAAEGVTIMTHQANKAYLEKVLNAPHTLNPDKMTESKRKPKFETLASRKVLTDGDRVVELHHLQNFGHHEGAIVVYLPKEKILLQADAFNPPAQPVAATPATISPYNVSLVDNIARLKLDVERIIPVHYPADNRKITMAELLKVAGR